MFSIFHHIFLTLKNCGIAHTANKKHYVTQSAKLNPDSWIFKKFRESGHVQNHEVVGLATLIKPKKHLSSLSTTYKLLESYKCLN